MKIGKYKLLFLRNLFILSVYCDTLPFVCPQNSVIIIIEQGIAHHTKTPPAGNLFIVYKPKRLVPLFLQHAWSGNVLCCQNLCCFADSISLQDVYKRQQVFDRADVMIAPTSLETARFCGMCLTSETFAGKIRVRAASIPAQAITAEYWIQDGKEK